MANIFTLENLTDFTEKLNIDDLYEKKKQQDLNKLTLYNKILNRIHVRIKATARLRADEHFCWYLVPEIIIGVPKYDQGACIAYLVDKLQVNGFSVKYIHPNMLMISWNNWVPSYVRSELKKKTGIAVDEYGREIGQPKAMLEERSLDESLFKRKEDPAIVKPTKKFTPIDSYKPQGSLVYDDELLQDIGSRFDGSKKN